MTDRNPTAATWQLPRSALLAAWGTAALTGRASADQARQAVQRLDEPHLVQSPTAELDLIDWLGGLRAVGTRGLRCLLPLPGAGAGLPGPVARNLAFMAAGECVASVNGPPIAAQPQVTEFGSTWEPGALVRWQLAPSAGPAVRDFVDLRQAEREFRAALLESASELRELELFSQVAQPRTAPGIDPLPPGSDSAAVELLSRATRILAAVACAAADDRAAVSSWQLQVRSAALDRVARSARVAVAAAVNDPLRYQL